MSISDERLVGHLLFGCLCVVWVTAILWLWPLPAAVYLFAVCTVVFLLLISGIVAVRRARRHSASLRVATLLVLASHSLLFGLYGVVFFLGTVLDRYSGAWVRFLPVIVLIVLGFIQLRFKIDRGRAQQAVSASIIATIIGGAIFSAQQSRTAFIFFFFIPVFSLFLAYLTVSLYREAFPARR